MGHEESEKEVKDYAKFARDVKNYLLVTGEKLSRQAFDEGDLKICDVAESVCEFYDTLPSKSKPKKVIKKQEEEEAIKQASQKPRDTDATLQLKRQAENLI